MLLGVRWTIGDVSARGFEALRLSIWGAQRLFGPRARYAVVHNSIARGAVEAQLGPTRAPVELVASDGVLPPSLRGRVDPRMADGVAWKLAPLRLFPSAHELALDNDCILWSLPSELGAWLNEDEGVLLAEDVRRGFGAFDALCGARPLNSGLRGLPPAFDLDAAFARVISAHDRALACELDEQGLQAAALFATGRLRVVSADDVSVCSPFPPHVPHLGRCGAHFVGLNSRALGWDYAGQPAEVVRAAHWDALASDVAALVGAPPRRQDA
jgi:hypothetical protein